LASKKKATNKKVTKRKTAKKKPAKEIRLDFIPSEMLYKKSPNDKLAMILSKVKKDIIVVLEEALTPQEEASLIQQAMEEIDSKNFFGIEFYRMGHREATLLDKISNFITKRRAGITIVGPTRMVEAIKKEPEHISVFARTGG
jgi:hypothetical protein